MTEPSYSRLGQFEIIARNGVWKRPHSTLPPTVDQQEVLVLEHDRFRLTPASLATPPDPPGRRRNDQSFAAALVLFTTSDRQWPASENLHQGSRSRSPICDANADIHSNAAIPNCLFATSGW